LVAGFLRGVTLFFTGQALNLIPAEDVLHRLIGAPLYVAAIYMALNTMVQAHLDHRKLSNELMQERERLQFSRLDFAGELRRLKEAQTAKVQELITPAIWELKKLLSDAALKRDATIAIAALRDINDELVRPLSHSMTKAFEFPNITGSLRQTARLGQFVLPAKIRTNQVFQFGIFVPFTAVMSYSGLSAVTAPIAALVISLLATALYTLQLWGWSKILGNRLRGIWSTLGIATGVGVQLGLSTILVVNIPGIDIPDELVLQSVLFFVQTMIGLFAIGVVQQQRNTAVLELRTVNDELKLLNSQLRQQVWLSQKMLATELHGVVQATLSSSAMRLSQLESPTAEDLERVRNDIDGALGRLGRADYLEGASFEELMEQICDLWSGSCQIDYRISTDAIDELQDSSALAYCTLEVIREAINNAIRHGKAKNIEVAVGKRSNSLELSISNDGQAPAAVQSGLGSELFEELTLSHELIPGSPTRFWALVPVTQSEPKPQP
jgi:signal transduction histidine kinase